MDILLNPTEDYKTIKTYRLNRHPFSTNYLFEFDEKFVASALTKIADENGMINVNDIVPYFSSMKAFDKAHAGKGTQLKKTENYDIFKVYIYREFRLIAKDLLSSDIDFNEEIRLDIKFGALAKYDLDGLTKGFIDAFAEFFMNGEDNNIKELNLSFEPVDVQSDGFIEITICNI